MQQNAKKNNFSGLFSIAILRKSSSCVTSYQDVLVSFAFYQDSIRSYFTCLYFKNLYLRLSSCLSVVARSVVTLNKLFGCVFLI